MKISILTIIYLYHFTIEQLSTKDGKYIFRIFKDTLCNDEDENLKFEIGQLEENNSATYNNSLLLYYADWDGYSNTLQLLYSIDEVVEEEKEIQNLPSLKITCNGICGKIFFFNNTEETRYFTCIYNNIHPTFTFEISRYNGTKNCDKEHLIETNTFFGNKTCWIDSDTFSLMPTQWIDERNKLTYTTFKNSKCKGGNVNVSQSYAVCNGKCFNNETDEAFSYKCTRSSMFFIQYNIYLIFSIFFIYI